MALFSDSRKPYLRRRNYSVSGAISCVMGVLALIVAALLGLDKDTPGLMALVLFVLSAGLMFSLGLTGVIVGFVGLIQRRQQRLLPVGGIVVSALALLVLLLELWWPSISGMVIAAHDGDLVSVQRALRMGVDVNGSATVQTQRQAVRTSLTAAAEGGQFTITKLLLDRGAKVDQEDGEGVTALYLAAETGRLKIVDLLLEQGASPKFTFEGKTPLHLAAAKGYRDIGASLIKAGADVNVGTRTALHEAAANGHFAMVKLLLEKGAKVDPRDARQRTPLHEAAAQGHDLAVKLLLEYRADANAADDEEAVPLDLAVRNNRERVVQRLRSSGSRTNVFVAIGLRDTQQLSDILDRDPAQAQTTRQGRTPLHDAAAAGLDEAVDLLLKHKADPNPLDDKGITPLLLACSQGHAEVVDRLLAAGADPSITYVQDAVTAPVLYFAVVGGHAGVVQKLLEHGVDVNAACIYGQLHGSPLYFAIKSRQLAIARLLLTHRAQVNAQHSPGSPTPLYEAVRLAEPDAVKLLLENGANPAQEVANQTPLQLAETKRSHDPEAYAVITDALLSLRKNRP